MCFNFFVAYLACSGLARIKRVESSTIRKNGRIFFFAVLFYATFFNFFLPTVERNITGGSNNRLVQPVV